MGGDLIRFHLDWSRLMPDAFMRVDQSYQDRVDQVMAWVAAYRVKVILNLVGTPCWAPASGPSCPLSRDVMFSAPRPDIFQATTRYLLQRYPSLYAYEVWNEPNLARNLLGRQPRRVRRRPSTPPSQAPMKQAPGPRSLPAACSWMARAICSSSTPPECTARTASPCILTRWHPVAPGWTRAPAARPSSARSRARAGSCFATTITAASG